MHEPNKHASTHTYLQSYDCAFSNGVCGKIQVNELLKAADEGEKRRVEEGMYVMSCWRVIRIIHRKRDC